MFRPHLSFEFVQSPIEQGSSLFLVPNRLELVAIGIGNSVLRRCATLGFIRANPTAERDIAHPVSFPQLVNNTPPGHRKQPDYRFVDRRAEQLALEKVPAGLA